MKRGILNNSYRSVSFPGTTVTIFSRRGFPDAIPCIRSEQAFDNTRKFFHPSDGLCLPTALCRTGADIFAELD
jgi:hypothetical protein